MKTLNIDIETYSSVDIKKSGLYKYVESPDFEILLFAYSVNNDPTVVIDLAQGRHLPHEIELALNDPNVIKYAFNAAFECVCISKFYKTNITQWRCTMVHGYYCGYGGGLGKVAQMLNLPEDKRKATVGQALIRYFCAPVRSTKVNGGRTRNLPHHDLDKWKLFIEYCRQDVEVEKEVSRRLSAFPVPDEEWEMWYLDQRINAAGVPLDRELVNGALHILSESDTRLMDEARRITGLDNPNSDKQLKGWLESKGISAPNLQKSTVSDLIEKSSGDVKRMLEIRQELGKTSVKKYATMAETVCADDRIRGLFQFYGGYRTGRWAGRFVQPQNLPRNSMSEIDLARKLTKSGCYDTLRFVFGNVPDTLSQIIRTALIPSDGSRLVISDFSAIEARVIAWLAKEEWRMQVFRTHGKIYEASAAQMFGVPFERIKKGNPEYELRSKGKVAELALGYQGAGSALISMGALSSGLTEKELPDIVKRWRSANTRITGLWRRLDNAAIQVLKDNQPTITDGLVFAREFNIQTGLDFLTIRLPSGRKLYYCKPFLKVNDFGREAVHYHAAGTGKTLFRREAMYGGRWTENVVQAVARDCLAEAMKRLSRYGFEITMHIHDEVVLNVPKQYADLDKINKIMAEPVMWAQDLPLQADGFISDYYMKD